eukprot:1820264-Prymnesium_polylepis.2
MRSPGHPPQRLAHCAAYRVTAEGLGGESCTGCARSIAREGCTARHAASLPLQRCGTRRRRSLRCAAARRA